MLVPQVKDQKSKIYEINKRTNHWISTDLSWCQDLSTRKQLLTVETKTRPMVNCYLRVVHVIRPDPKKHCGKGKTRASEWISGPLVARLLIGKGTNERTVHMPATDASLFQRVYSRRVFLMSGWTVHQWKYSNGFLSQIFQDSLSRSLLYLIAKWWTVWTSIWWKPRVDQTNDIPEEMICSPPGTKNRRWA